MAGETTTYRVETIFDVTDKASAALGSIKRHAAEAAHSATTLRNVLGGVGAAVIGSSFIHHAKAALIDFNKEVQNAKISLAAMVQGNFIATWDQAKNKADEMYAAFQKFSVMTPVTTQELLEFSRGIAVATAQTGGNIKDIVNVTEQGVIAAKALGAGSQYASMEISHMLSGNINRRMIFAQQLLGMMGMDEAKFKGLGSADRLKKVKEVLNSPAMKNAANEFQTSFSGVTSTLEDKLQILGGKVGLPLFKAITKEVASWNDWLDKNNYTVTQIAHTVGEKLVEGFKMVKSVVAFMVDHAGIIMKIGEVWAITKIGSALSNGLVGTLGGFGAAGGTLMKGIGGKDGVGLGSALGAAGSALSLGYAFGTLINQTMGLSDAMTRTLTVHGQVLDMTDETTRKYASLIQSMDTFDDMTGKAAEALSHLEGAAGTAASSRIGGQSAAFMQQANVLKQVLASEGGSGGFAGMARKFNNQELMKSVGIDPEEVARRGANAVYEDVYKRSQKEGEINKDAIAAANTAWAELPQKVKDAVDQQKVLNALVQRYLSDTIGKSGLQPSQFQMGWLFSKSMVDEVLRNVDPELKNKTPVNQTINVNINQVSAKDPDRWIAEIDEYAARKARSRTRAKGAPARGF